MSRKPKYGMCLTPHEHNPGCACAVPESTLEKWRAGAPSKPSATPVEQPHCSQCGQPWSARACGPTHALIAASKAPAERDGEMEILARMADAQATLFELNAASFRASERETLKHEAHPQYSARHFGECAANYENIAANWRRIAAIVRAASHPVGQYKEAPHFAEQAERAAEMMPPGDRAVLIHPVGSSGAAREGRCRGCGAWVPESEVIGGAHHRQTSDTGYEQCGPVEFTAADMGEPVGYAWLWRGVDKGEWVLEGTAHHEACVLTDIEWAKREWTDAGTYEHACVPIRSPIPTTSE